MVTAWADPSIRPGTYDDGGNDRYPSRAKVKWNLVDPTERNQFLNGLEAELRSVGGENLLDICKLGPPDGVRFAAHQEPGATMTLGALS
jgi:hypothetical protein